MKHLGANSIRVYHVDPQAKHDDCMKTFADAGIYIWLDLDTFDTYIQGPGMEKPQWNESQYKAYQRVMDVFHSYDNLGGFFVGNEVLTSPETDVAAPYVKAAASDMKAYRDRWSRFTESATWKRTITDVVQTRATERFRSDTQQQTSRAYDPCCRTTWLADTIPQQPSTFMVSTPTNGESSPP